MEPQTKLFNIKLIDIFDKREKLSNLQNTEGALRVQEINFDDGETKAVVNANLFLDTHKIVEDIKINLKNLEQHNKKAIREEKRNSFGSSLPR